MLKVFNENEKKKKRLQATLYSFNTEGKEPDRSLCIEVNHMPRKKSTKCKENEKKPESLAEQLFTEKQLLQNSKVQSWLKTVSERTRTGYLNALTKFCNFTKKSPDELINERHKEILDTNLDETNGIRDSVLDFRKHLEKQKSAPKTIHTHDGAVRSFFSRILGKRAMINVRNYDKRHDVRRKDLIPNLEEVKSMIDVSDLEGKVRIIFVAQTGMRVSDVLKLKVGHVQRELESGKIPLVITFVPTKDSEVIGERMTFLASDGVEILKQYLEWRKRNGEKVNEDSPLFVGRTNRGIKPITQARFNKTIKEAAKKAGLNGDNKFGIMRTHCLRKFFITQLTNHGVEDKVINFLSCHKISDVDRVYWERRPDILRDIYAERQQYLNPINGKKNSLDFKGGELENMVKKIISEELTKTSFSERYESKIVTTDQEIIELSMQGYDCQPIGNSRWLMRRKTADGSPGNNLENIPLPICNNGDNDKAAPVKLTSFLN